jgi:hypothetical protein
MHTSVSVSGLQVLSVQTNIIFRPFLTFCRSIWTWECVGQEKCRRRYGFPGNLTSLPVCWLTCGKARTLWPLPSKNVSIKSTTSTNTHQHSIAPNPTNTLSVLDQPRSHTCALLSEQLPSRDRRGSSPHRRTRRESPDAHEEGLGQGTAVA